MAGLKAGEIHANNGAGTGFEASFKGMGVWDHESRRMGSLISPSQAINFP
jgi:hypothetical protein